MLEYAGSQTSGTRAERERRRRARRRPALARLGARSPASRRSSPSASGRSPASRTSTSPHDPNYYLDRQIVYVVRRGASCSWSRALIDPDMYRRYWRPIFIGTVRRDRRSSSSSGTPRAARRAGSDVGFFTFQPSEFGKLLFVLAIAGFLAERAARRQLGDDAARLGLGRDSGRARLRPAGPRHRARLHRGARRDALRRGTPWRQLAVLGWRRRARRGRRPLGRAGRRRRLPQAVPEVASHLLHASRDLPGRRPVQRRAVDRGRRLRPVPRPRPEERDADAPRLPAGARQTDFVFASFASSAASSARRSCSRSTCSSCGAACASSRSRAISSRRSSPAGSSSRCSSRSSSTSA